MNQSTTEAQQKLFDEKYIAAADIQNVLNVDRMTIIRGVDAGKLPAPIRVGKETRLYLWVREEAQPFIDAWLLQLNERRA